MIAMSKLSITRGMNRLAIKKKEYVNRFCPWSTSPKSPNMTRYWP